MKKLFAIMMISLVLFSCKTQLVPKKYLVKGTTDKYVEGWIPSKCDKFSEGVTSSFDVMAKYAGKELASASGSYQMALKLSEYSSRIKTICASQCEINKNTVVIDPNIADNAVYIQLIQNYTEYQKIKDLIDSNPSEAQKTIIVNGIVSAYNSFNKIQGSGIGEVTR